MPSLHNIADLLPQYETFILDIWGVLHQGTSALPGAKELIDILNAQHKEYYILSNTPRPVLSAHNKLTSLGLEVPVSRILTSGAFFLAALENPDILPEIPLTGKAALIGREKNEELLHNANINIASDLSEADYLIMLAFAHDHRELQYYATQLSGSRQYNLPMVCVNPDHIALQGHHKVYCQGHFAAMYAQMGGKVHYFGKPYTPIYHYLFDQHKLKKNQSLMIGDSLTTDIQGACNFGIDSALVLTGIHKDERDIANLLKLHTNKPTYILSNLEMIYDRQETQRA